MNIILENTIDNFKDNIWLRNKKKKNNSNQIIKSYLYRWKNNIKYSNSEKNKIKSNKKRRVDENNTNIHNDNDNILIFNNENNYKHTDITENTSISEIKLRISEICIDKMIIYNNFLKSNNKVIKLEKQNGILKIKNESLIKKTNETINENKNCKNLMYILVILYFLDFIIINYQYIINKFYNLLYEYYVI